MLGTVQLIMLGMFMDVTDKAVKAGRFIGSKLESLDYKGLSGKVTDSIPPIKKYKQGRQFNNMLDKEEQPGVDSKTDEDLELLEWHRQFSNKA